MKYFENVLKSIGNTPMIKINKVQGDCKALLLAKVETTNPGNSIKDRMALKMIEEAEKDGLLKPGGTIIEGTSGNTGMGLAIAAVVKGYRCIFTTTDKQSKEKVDMLKACGAEVIVCPTNVESADPRSYYSVAKELSRKIPNSVYLNQYDNLANRQAHYEQTGPEIWEQTDGKITHLVVGVGTGGTISGTGKFLKEKNPDIQIIGIDTYGSVFKKYHETGIFDEKEIYPYITEGIGEDILPANVDFSVIDHFEKVSDKDGLVYTRRLAREEGILVGNSAGSAIAGVVQMKDRFKEGDVVVVIFHDHASRYMGKAFNDDWMRERGFLDDARIKAADILSKKESNLLITIDSQASVSDALDIMSQHNISQIPVFTDKTLSGTVTESQLFKELVKNNDARYLTIANLMEPPLPILSDKDDINSITHLLNSKAQAVLVEKSNGEYGIISKFDIIKSIT